MPVASDDNTNSVTPVTSTLTSTITTVDQGTTTTYTSYYTTIIITETVHVGGQTKYVTKYGSPPATDGSTPAAVTLTSTGSASLSSGGTITLTSSGSDSTYDTFETITSVELSAKPYSTSASDNTCYFYYDFGDETTDSASTTTSTKTVYQTVLQNN